VIVISLGLLLALALPALAAMRLGFTDVSAALVLAVTPYLTLAWVWLVERRSPASIGLTRPTWKLVPLAIAGVLVNLAITASVTALTTRLGIVETQSDLMGRLLQGPGLLLMFLATNGALLTEISFRAYSTERLGELLGRDYRVAALLQIAITTAVFVAGRGLAHGMVWLVDDVVFTAYYLHSRNTPVCIAAHAIPNLVASSLVALGVAH
jgi:membrane protease YdiL (CAAX protease family)